MNNFYFNIQRFAINNTVEGSAVNGTSDADAIYNYASYTLIKGGAGDDTIINSTTNYTSTVTKTVTTTEYEEVPVYGYVTETEYVQVIKYRQVSHYTPSYGYGTGTTWYSEEPYYSYEPQTVTKYKQTGTRKVEKEVSKEVPTPVTLKTSNTDSTINAGTGDDIISIDSSAKNTYIKYSEGDGNDTIYGFNENNVTLQISGTSQNTVTSGDDVIIYVGDGSMLLKNTSVSGLLDTVPADNTINTKSSAVQNVSADDAGNIYIILEDDILTVEGGEGKTVKFKNDFISGDPLDVQFAHSLKINDEAKFYWGVGEDATLALNDYAPTAINVSLNNSNFNDTSNVAFYGDIKTIDARGYTGYALLSGKDNVDNVIYGNETSCAMWGGNGGNDTLIGGNGSDLFWYVNGGGTDVVQNANSNDTVRFDGITLDELVGGGGQIIGNDVKVELKNGGSLTVENARNSEVVFDFNDTKYAVNSSTGEWEFR